MSYRWAVPTLLVVPFLALACSEQPTLLEVPAISADVTTEAAPASGEFVTSVRGGFPGCVAISVPDDGGADPSGEVDWNAVNGAPPCIIVTVMNGGQPVHRGTVTLQYCKDKGGSGARPDEACNTRGGEGTWVTWSRMSLDSGNDGIVTFGGPFTLSTRQGFRWKYTGQGSGTANYRSESFDVY